MKKNSWYFILSIIVLAVYIYQYFQIDTNLDSIYDEGFLYLKLQAAQAGEVEGTTQWTSIIAAIFGKTISSDLLYLRYARFFMHTLSVLIFSLASIWYLYKNCIFESISKTKMPIIITFLFGTIALGGIVLSYNQLQELFLIAILTSFLLTLVTNSNKVFIYYLIIGFFSFLSIMTILPSGVLVSGFVVLLTWVKYIHHWKKSLVYTIFIIVGFLFSALLFHLFIVNLHDVYAAMIQTAETITKVNRGYDPLSFILKIFLYFRDFFIGSSVLLGALVLSILIAKFTRKWLGAVVFLVAVSIVSFYMKKPAIDYSTFIAFPIVILFIAKLISTSDITIRDIFNFNTLFPLFLFFLPLICAIGTNTTLASKMLTFILPWSLLFSLLLRNNTIKEEFIRETNLFVGFLFLIILIQPLQSMIYSAKNKSENTYTFLLEKPISKIRISKSQKEYFDNVYGIMKQYNYHRNDIIFSTQLDHMTITAFDATPCGIYFQPSDFLADINKSNLKRPKFLFLTTYDISLIDNSLKSLSWGFPEDYDQFYVGTPETIVTGYPTDRTLYCLKANK